MKEPQAPGGGYVDGLAAALFAVAFAFLSFAALDALAGAPLRSPLALLAPRQTLARLWVFFVLAPAVVGFVGVGLPCLLRASATGFRGRLGPRERRDLLLLVGAAVLIAAEAAGGGSGGVALALTAAASVWRLWRALARLGAGALPGGLLALAAVALLGFARYELALLGGRPASPAVAPSLFLLAFYGVASATLLSWIRALAGKHADRRLAASTTALVVYVTWLGLPPLRAGTAAGEHAAVWATLAAALFLAIGALAHARRESDVVDAGRRLH